MLSRGLFVSPFPAPQKGRNDAFCLSLACPENRRPVIPKLLKSRSSAVRAVWTESMACDQCRKRKVKCTDAHREGPGPSFPRRKRRSPDLSSDESTDEPRRQRRQRTATNNGEEDGEDSPIYENDDPSSADVPQPDLVHSTRDPAPDL